MTKYSLKYNKYFVSDVAEVHDYISQKLSSPKAANNFVKNLNKCIKNIQTMPEAYKIYTNSKKLKNEVRHASFENFSIFYSASDKTIELYRLLYSKRNLKNIIK